MLHATQTSPLGAITAGNIKSATGEIPAVLREVAGYTSDLARAAPDIIPVLKNLLPLMPLGPTVATLVAPLSADVASVLRKAPQYTGLIQRAITLMGRAPDLAPKLVSTLNAMARTAQAVGDDPALGPFIDRLNQLIAIYEARSSGSSSSTGPSRSPTKGVGLSKLIPWLDRAIMVAKAPWIAGAAATGAVVVVIGFGFALGRATR